MRRQLLLGGAGCLGLGWSGAGLACPNRGPKPWPMWEQFKQRFIQADGRVVDHSVPPGQTTSEGQSYAMFFALVHKDMEMFQTLWKWSQANLAQGDMKARLPAWLWGSKPDGSWGVVDANAASDADAWFAYVLLEAGRLWSDKTLTQTGQALLERMAKEEVADLPGLGKMLLPGPQGFVKTVGGEKLWRINPSYLPLFQLRRFAQEAPAGPWAEMVRNTVSMLTQMGAKGVAPDWLAYGKSEQGDWRFLPDPDTPATGSYDAIRTYLWAGMTDRLDDFRGTVLRRLSGMIAATNALDGVPPEVLEVSTGLPKSAKSPPGFSAALLPYFKSSGQSLLHRLQHKRIQAEYHNNPAGTLPLTYYDYVLGLFGTGWDEGRYSFAATGQLKPNWDSACPSKPER